MRLASHSLKECIFQVAEIWSLDLPHDDFARPHINTADPLSLVNHHAFCNCIDSTAIEIGHARRTERRHGPAKPPTQLFKLQIYGH